jgi:hypothetical protein
LLLQEKSSLEDLSISIRVKDGQTKEVMAALEEERSRAAQSELMMKAQQIILLKSLRNVYPITARSDGRYSIHNLEIPSDLFSGVIPEDELSAALGLVCHLLHMMTKYLHVRSRYRLNCYSSRSAVQDDRGNMYPLFQTRGVDREQLERGFKCLEGVACCIASSQGLSWANDDMHILAKIDKIFDNVVDGH